jgi:hypothetical protein
MDAPFDSAPHRRGIGKPFDRRGMVPDCARRRGEFFHPPLAAAVAVSSKSPSRSPLFYPAWWFPLAIVTGNTPCSFIPQQIALRVENPQVTSPVNPPGTRADTIERLTRLHKERNNVKGNDADDGNL